MVAHAAHIDVTIEDYYSDRNDMANVWNKLSQFHTFSPNASASLNTLQVSSSLFVGNHFPQSELEEASRIGKVYSARNLYILSSDQMFGKPLAGQGYGYRVASCFIDDEGKVIPTPLRRQPKLRSTLSAMSSWTFGNNGVPDGCLLDELHFIRLFQEFGDDDHELLAGPSKSDAEVALDDLIP